MNTNIKSIFLCLILSSLTFCSCVDKKALKEELKAELEQEQQLQQLKSENQELKEKIAQKDASTKKESYSRKEKGFHESKKLLEKKSDYEETSSVPDKIQIKNADNQGVVLRERPSDATKMTGEYNFRFSDEHNPHFMTGYVFECYGVSGSFYKVFYENDYYYIPKRYASPYSGSRSVGGPMK